MATEEHRVVIGVDYTGQQGVAQYLADLQKLGLGAERSMQRIRNALRNGDVALPTIGPSRAARALPAGAGGTQDLGRAQSDYVRALNDRSRALREASRAERFQQRVNAIIETANPRRGAVAGIQMDERTGAIRGLEFTRNLEDNSRAVRDLAANVNRLNAQINAQHAAATPSPRELNSTLRQTNEAAIHAYLDRAIANNPTTGGQHQIDELRQIIEGLKPKSAERTALYDNGLVTYSLAARLTPEMREVLTGSADHPRSLGLRAGETVGNPIPGTIGRAEMRREIQAAGVDPQLLARHAAAEAHYTRALEQQAAFLEQQRPRTVGAPLGAGPTPREAPLYHGSQSALPSRLLPRDQVVSHTGQMFGPGMYATPDRDFAAWHAGDKGRLYELSAPGKTLDLNTLMPQAEIAALRARFQKLHETLDPAEYGYMDGPDRVAERLGRHLGPGAEPLTYAGAYSHANVFNPTLTQHLEETHGVTKLQGGQGGRETVFLRPEEVTVAQARVTDELVQVLGARVAAERQATAAATKQASYDAHLDSASFPQRDAVAAAAEQGPVVATLNPARGPARFVHDLPAGRPRQADVHAAQAVPQVAEAQRSVSTALVHLKDLVTETYPEYERARRAVEARAQAEEQAARAAQGAVGGGNGRSGGGAPPPPPPRTGGGDHPDNFGDSASADRVRRLEEEALAREAEASNRLLKSKLNLVNAQDHLEAVLNKDAIEYGTKGGFKDPAAADQAIRGALVREQAARAQVEAAEKKLAEALAAETAAHERRAAPVDTGQVHGPGMPMTQETQQAVLSGLQTGGALSGVQAAQQRLALAQSNLAAATKTHQQVMNGQYLNQQQAGAAYASSLGNLTQAQRAQAHAAAQLGQAQANAANVGGGTGGGGGRGGGGFFTDFGAGFRGNPNTPIATQLGQTARFSVFYGTMYKALFAITQTFQNAVQEGIAFEDALTDLAIAANRSKAEVEGFANDLGQESVRAGFEPSQGVEIGARSLGLYGAVNAPLETQKQVGLTSARVVSQMAVGAKGVDPVQLQGDIAAITQALGLGAEGLQRVADLDAYATKQFGIQQGSTLQAVGESASVGKAAGFSDEQLFSIAADMISRTGQTPSAVAGYMAQIFSRGGEGSLTAVAQSQGVDPNQNLAQQVQQLSNIYKTADPRAQAQISAAFGRGKVQNAAVALLGDYSAVNQVANKASGGAADNAANEQFREHMNNIGGQIREFGGELKQFAQLLGQAGILDALGAAVVFLKALTETGNTLLGVFNELPRPLRDIILLLGLTAAAQRAGLVGAGVSKVLAAGAGSSLVPMVGPLSRGAIRPLVDAGTGEAAGFGRSAAAAGKGLWSMIGPIGLAVGGLMAIAALKSSADRVKAAQDSATAALQAGGGLGPTSTAEDYRAQAAELRSQADTNQHATGWVAQALTFGHANDASMATARQLRQEASQLKGIAAGIPDPNAARPRLFQSMNDTDVQSGLTQIEQSGGTATTALKALRDVLYGTAGAAKAAQDAFDPHKFANQEAIGLQAAGLASLDNIGDIGSTVGGGSVDTDPTRFGGLASTDFGGNRSDALKGKDVKNKLRGILQTPEMAKQLEGLIAANNITSATGIDDATAGQIADQMAGTATKALIAQLGPGVRVDADKIRAGLADAYKQKLLHDTRATKEVVGGTSTLTRQQATSFANRIVEKSEGRLGNLPEAARRDRITELQGRIADLRQIGRRTDGGETADLLKKLREARSELVENQLAEIDGIRKVAMANATTRAQATSAGQSALRQKVRAVVRNGTADQLAQLISEAGKEARAMARKAIDDAIKVDSAVIATEQALADAARAAAAANPSLNKPGVGIDGEPIPGPGAKLPQGKSVRQQNAEADRRRLRRQKHALQTTPSADADSDPFKASETDAEVQAAQAAAAAAQSRSPVAAARAAMQGARAQMNKLIRDHKKDSTEYWAVVGQLHDAQNQYAEAISAIPVARAQALATRSKSPLAAARATIAAGRKQVADAKGDQAAYWAGMQTIWDGQNQLAAAAAAIPTSRAQAQAARSGGAIASARVSIVAGLAAMGTAKGDLAAFNQGLAQFYDGQQALRAALLAYRKNVMLLGVDMTNPLRMAQVETRAAAQKLASDLAHHQSRDVIAQDRVDVRTARANQESTAFQQRLQAVQTADNLGRITHTSYMRYLEHEHDRLTAVRHRTFQQQQELDQIDGLMKDAATAMQGQFNLGDIKLPTPYQVRRYIQQQAGAASQTATSVQNVQTVHIQIDGADTAKVTRIVKDVVGKSARTMTAAPRRR